MAGLIFTQLVDVFRLDLADRPLLEAAARLQDVGYLINYDQHHKHSYHLILHSRLDGFQPHELELVANVARYHRGARPKKKHANFQQLSSKDQQKVKQLAAILRVAGGLDRSNTQQVQALTVQNDGDTMKILVLAPQYPEVDIWGARRRTELFDRVFDTTLEIDWASPNHETNGSAAGANSEQSRKA
jgi:exopolyphosphatase/guanosine-5'-triphosphate,3'-diphosphate pyrophosphatase